MSELRNITELPVAESTEGAMLTGHVDGRAVQIPMNKIGQVKVYGTYAEAPGHYIDPDGEIFSIDDLEKLKQLITDFKTGIVIIEDRVPDEVIKEMYGDNGLMVRVSSLMLGYRVNMQSVQGELANMLSIFAIDLNGVVHESNIGPIPYDFFD